MPTNTTNMALPKPIDSDNAEAALASSIATGFDKIDVHTHGGGAAGLAIATNAIPNAAAIANPTISGTVAGGASYTAPTITSPTITGPTISGTVAGGATYTSPTVSGHLHASGSQGSAAVGTGIGGGGSVSLQGNDIRGIVTLNVGTAPGTQMATVTFASAFTSAPCVVLSLYGNTPGAVSLWVSALTTTTFVINFTAAPTASQAYQVYYHAIDMG